jgi:hypothetical protein
MRRTLRRLTLLALIAASAGALRAQSAAGPGADATLVRAVQDHDWTLQSAIDAGGKPVESLLVPGDPFVMRFDGARLGVRSCGRSAASVPSAPDRSTAISRAVERGEVPTPFAQVELTMGPAE